MWKHDEFVWKSEKNLYGKPYSKYSFFDFKCILSIVFQVQFLGCRGKPKFQFHILCRWMPLYIYNLYGTMVATSCDLNAPRCTTKVPQLRLHGS